MSAEQAKHTLTLTKEFLVWIIGIVFSTNVACVDKLLSVNNAHAAPEYLLSAIAALSFTLAFAILLFLRLIFLSSKLPDGATEYNILLAKHKVPSLKSLLFTLMGLVFTSFVLVLLWVF